MSKIIYPLKDGIGFVELLDVMGNDLTAVNAARVSYGKTSEQLTDKDIKLIHYLMKHRHGTPFEHATLSFRVKAPLFVVHQWQRHRMASYNEESGRYIELQPEFYTPSNRDKAVADYCYQAYQLKLKEGYSKEDARLVLPVSLYKTFWFTINTRGLMNFLSLRNSFEAQHEIREYAKAVEALWIDVMPETHQAFIDNNRVAP